LVGQIITKSTGRTGQTQHVRNICLYLLDRYKNESKDWSDTAFSKFVLFVRQIQNQLEELVRPGGAGGGPGAGSH
jgi:hypothetical protein